MPNVYIDGACSGNPGPSGIGIYIPSGNLEYKYNEHIGEATNNEAEATALRRAIEIILDRFVSQFGPNEVWKIFSDSQLIVNQYLGRWEIKEARLGAIYAETKRIIADWSKRTGKSFTLTLVKIPGSNEYQRVADSLAKEATKPDISIKGKITMVEGEVKDDEIKEILAAVKKYKSDLERMVDALTEASRLSALTFEEIANAMRDATREVDSLSIRLENILTFKGVLGDEYDVQDKVDQS